MNETTFLERREPDWQRLVQLCDRADVSPAQLSPAEFQEFVRLYRRVSADLATVRTRSGNAQLLEFLNDLVGRAYGTLYREPRRPAGALIVNAILAAAQTVRKRALMVLLSALTLIGGAVFSYVLLETAPATRSVLVPEGTDELFKRWTQGEHDPRTGAESIGMTAFYMSNNPRVALTAGALAASTFGVGTFYILFQNGGLIGSLSHEMFAVNKGFFLYSSILPHGVPELTGIVLSGAAGFTMGWALINPGRRKRGEALRVAGRDAIVLLATAYTLMFIAAPIEGFFSFNPAVPQAVKMVFAVVTAGLWAAFWIGYGRDRDPVLRDDAEPT